MSKLTRRKLIHVVSSSGAIISLSTGVKGKSSYYQFQDHREDQNSSEHQDRPDVRAVNNLDDSVNLEISILLNGNIIETVDGSIPPKTITTIEETLFTSIPTQEVYSANLYVDNELMVSDVNVGITPGGFDNYKSLHARINKESANLTITKV